MKRTFLIAFLSILSLKIMAQTESLARHNAVNDSMILLYNQRDFKSIHKFLHPEFQAKMSEAQLVAFFEKNVFPAAGKVVKSTHLKPKKKGELYRWTGEKAELQLSLFVDSNKLIYGFLFQPFMEETSAQKRISSTNNPMKTALDKMVDSIARTHVDFADKAGLSIGIIKDGKTNFYHYGEMDKVTHQQPDNQTFYEIGSVTKTFTGVLLAKAILDKKLSLEDDIRKYLPEGYPNLQFKNQPILIKHLASHTSRLPSFPVDDITSKKDYDAQNPYKHYTKEMVLAHLRTIKLDTTPGIQSEYSNFATGLMGIILQKVYQKTYDDLLKTHITRPLSMEATKIEINEKEALNFAKPYDEKGVLTHHWDLTGLAAAGAIRSNVVDMLTYTQANLSPSTEALKVAQQPIFEVSKERSIALYWQLTTTPKGQLMTWHNGGTGGFSTFCGFVKAKNIGLVVLSNSSENITDKAIELLGMIGL